MAPRSAFPWRMPFLFSSAAAADDRALGGAEFGEHGFTRNRRLADRNAGLKTFRKEDIETRSETDKTETLAGINRFIRLDPADDAAGDHAGNLHHADLAMCGLDDEAVAFIVFGRLVHFRIEEEARAVGDIDDAAAHRRAVHVAVENIHEDRDAHHRLLAEFQLQRRNDGLDGGDLAIGRADDQVVILRRHAFGIAEEVCAPGRQYEADPEQGFGYPAEHQRCDEEGGDEDITFLVDRYDGVANGVEQIHEIPCSGFRLPRLYVVVIRHDPYGNATNFA
ncbi:exported hypothetical protein [Agrobacterium genomosp. 5 str. CFBP 6626]|nr:exported hypothetical protein [Agrobacterium genomosp. 5 str. CFBP 6626]